MLAAIGRLSVRRGAGIFVASGGAVLGEDELAHYQPTDMEHVLMLLDYRRLIETETARRAASSAKPLEVGRSAQAAQESAEVGARGDAEAFAHADELPQRGRRGRAQHLPAVLGRDGPQVRRAERRAAVPRRGARFARGRGRQHVEIAEAIAAGAVEQAIELMAAHIDTTRHQFERRIRDRLFDLGGHR